MSRLHADNFYVQSGAHASPRDTQGLTEKNHRSRRAKF